MKQGFFITGTDTNVGKTTIACALLNALQRKQYTTLGIKPIASGADEINGKLRNADALLLQQTANVKLAYELINPYIFAAATAPHIAAQQQGQHLTLEGINQACQPALQTLTDIILVEGAGGWYCPINAQETLADFARLLGLPIILVVDVRVGSLNHSILTCKAIQADGCQLAGWIANKVDNTMNERAEYITELAKFIPAPLLGSVPLQSDLSIDTLADYLDVNLLL